MRLTLEVNKVIPGSYEKNGKHNETLDLLCTDKSDGNRLDHAVLFSPKPDQRAEILGADLRDRKIEVDVNEVRTNYAGAVVFRGVILPGSIPAVDGKGKLNVTKP